MTRAAQARVTVDLIVINLLLFIATLTGWGLPFMSYGLLFVGAVTIGWSARGLAGQP